MSRALDDLKPEFRAKVFELLARCVEEGIPVLIVDTLRTSEEQAANVARGVSWTLKSKHLTGEAIDLCPIRSYMGPGTTKANWDDVNPSWGELGRLGEALGLKWGVWKKSGAEVAAWRRRGELVNIDLGHFEAGKG